MDIGVFPSVGEFVQGELAQETYNVTIDNCISSDLRVENPNGLLAGFVGITAGPDTLLKNVVVKNSVFANILSDASSTDTSYSAAILFRKVINPKALNNTISDSTNGILLNECTDGVVKDNEVDSSDKAYVDLDETTSSLWVRNLAFGSTHEDNYDINWAGPAPVIEGELGAYPVTSQQWYNASVIH